MNKKISLILALVVVVLSVLGAKFIKSTPQKVKQKPPKNRTVSVDVMTLGVQNYAVNIPSFGRVNATTQSRLSSKVAGKVVSLNPAFRVGGVFKKGDVLLVVESDEYQSRVELSKAQLTEAQLALEKERALSAQARKNWDRLALDRTPSDLLLRKPFLASANAAVASAKAQLALAENNFNSAQVRAPFSGRVLTKQVDVGQVVSVNSVLGEIYRTDVFEVRLPIPESAVSLIDLPAPGKLPSSGLGVSVFNTLTPNKDKWSATIVLSEGAIDVTTQQLHVVAEINDMAESSGRRPLQLNQYVEALIHAKTLENVLVVPADYVRQDRYVYVLDDENRIQRRDVSVLWQSDKEVVISAGVMAGEELITTSVSDAQVGEQAMVNQRVSTGQSHDQNDMQPFQPKIQDSESVTQDTPTVGGLVKPEDVAP
ncbi:MAG: efflux RND transporter periplasmic adaptor subunit [Pseudomonadota bacterium]